MPTNASSNQPDPASPAASTALSTLPTAPSATSTRVATTPAARLLAPLDLPILPQGVSLPENPAFAELYGAAEDPQALRRAVEALLSPQALWLARVPQAFPVDLPVPPSGQLLAALYRYGNSREVWELYIEVQQSPQAWLEELRGHLAARGWRGGEGGLVTGPSGPEPDAFTPWTGLWCSRETPGLLLHVTLDMGNPDSTWATLQYQQERVADVNSPSPCGDGPTTDVARWAPRLAPPPEGELQRESTQQGSALVQEFRVRFPGNLQALLHHFRQQLQEQGWQVVEEHRGTLFRAAGALLIAQREVQPAPLALQLDLVVWEQGDEYIGWLYVTSLHPEENPALAPGTLEPGVQAATSDPALWRRFLAWNQAASAPGARVRLWVAQAPRNLPVSLPLPQDTTWVVAKQEQPLHGSRGPLWTLVLASPQEPQTLLRALHRALQETGWSAYQPSAMEVPMGMTLPEQQERFYCPPDRSLSLGLKVEPAPEGRGSWLRVSLVENAGPCGVTASLVDPALPQPPAARLSATGVELLNLPGGWGNWSPQGWKRSDWVYLWVEPEALMQRWARELQDQGWASIHWKALVPEVWWMTACYVDARGSTWQLYLLLQQITPRVAQVWIQVVGLEGAELR